MLSAISNNATFATMRHANYDVFPLRRPSKLRHVTLFLPSYDLLNLCAFHFYLATYLFYLPTCFLHDANNVLTLPFFDPHFVNAPLFHHNNFYRDHLATLIYNGRLLHISRFLTVRLLSYVGPFRRFLPNLFKRCRNLQDV